MGLREFPPRPILLYGRTACLCISMLVFSFHFFTTYIPNLLQTATVTRIL